MYLNEDLPWGVVHGKYSHASAYTNSMEKSAIFRSQLKIF